MKAVLQTALGVLLGLLATAGLVGIVFVGIDALLEQHVERALQRTAAPAASGALL
ncbi:hypothetical protein [Aquincola tertiaricarbonis]|uniref:hypothetical protein n=1 Tax=Aquincola tertiaricarbonis TaxID=391953 RepID=UPI0012EE9E4D|nr:hypothetical protein [Aquincola tertiaricarbonis]